MPILRTHDGKVLHHKMCTYCVFQHKKDMSTKTRKRQLEKCSLHNKIIPTPSEGNRYCEDYVQRGCECDDCKQAWIDLRIEEHLDKRTKLW